ncbi:disintegrin and metalloproteinase domain-containing protein 9-like [Neolamprologus brichardi]|uniref:disintegrin and metalloproteinase domain-containing protein 9-like n=1 Tax=Neolamprologus brichardi TaxID=32507 RepID=UPI001643D8A5|nr:disintegrin and metalloproteinase domain-containing protein 9-like [Neolamprologus brichardi]
MKMGGTVELLGISWLLFLLLLIGNGHCRDSHQTEHLSSYQLTVPRPIGGRLRRDVNGGLPNQVSYIISVDGSERVVHLERNAMLLPTDFTVFSYSPNGSLVTSTPPVQVTPRLPVCLLYMSLTGPVSQSHRSDSPALQTPRPFLSFMVIAAASMPLRTKRSVSQREVHVRRAVLHKTHYVELLLVVDNERFNFMSRNATAVREEMVLLANLVDSGFVQGVEGSSVAMSICNGLRGVMHLSDGSYGIEPLDSAPDQHLVYRLQDVTSQPRGCQTPHYEHGPNSTERAQASWEEIPHGQHRRVRRAVLHKTHYVELLLVVDNERFNFMSRNATAVREEMVLLANLVDSRRKNFGQTAGMAFVSTVCSRSHGGGINAFNNNLVASFASIVAHELGHNLGMNHDDGRQCTCPTGACIMNSGATGSKNFSSCSADDFEKMILLTGGACLLNVPRLDEAYSAPYCGNRLVDFGEECDCGSEKLCFKEVNSKGDRFGNCGYLNHGFKKCESRNAMCGKLQCSNVQAKTVFGIEPSIISTPIAGGKCYGVDFMLGSDVPDPGMVNEGTKCGENKVCVNFECRGADVLSYDCDVHTKCHGHGVCNSNRNCHCDYGWAPPFCELSGYGGSVDSGPTWNDKDTSVRDGLLVLFFVVLPLLALGVFVFLRRNELLRRLGLSRRKRSQGYEADGVASANHSRRPPPRAQPPPVARGNANNIVRDGHHAQLLPPQEVVETSRTAPSHALKPPPPPL